MNNSFRPLSLSEGFIFEKNNTLLRKFSKNDLTDIYIKLDEEDELNRPKSKFNSPNNIESDEQEYFLNENTNYKKVFNIENDEQKNEIKNISIWSNKIKSFMPDKKKRIYLLKKLFMFMIHLSLISIFETIFFFYIVSKYENEAITGVIINFFKGIPNFCYNLNHGEKTNFTQVFNSLVNITQIDAKANYSTLNRKLFNDKLFVNAWLYFLIIVGIDIVLFVIKFLYKIKINFKKIFLENFGMIIILGIYEYIFFQSIILLYENISQNELIKLIVGQFYTCLV